MGQRNSDIIKDAGIVYESFRIETIWDFWPYNLNPWYKSFEKRSTNQISDTYLQPRFVQIWDSQICIFKDSSHDTVLRIHQDSWGFVGFVKTGQIFWNQSTNWIHEPNLLKKLRIHDPRYKTNPDLYRKAWIEPFWSQDLWPRIYMNPWICETNPPVHNSLIQFPQP